MKTVSKFYPLIPLFVSTILIFNAFHKFMTIAYPRLNIKFGRNLNLITDGEIIHYYVHYLMVYIIIFFTCVLFAIARSSLNKDTLKIELLVFSMTAVLFVNLLNTRAASLIMQSILGDYLDMNELNLQKTSQCVRECGQIECVRECKQRVKN